MPNDGGRFARNLDPELAPGLDAYRVLGFDTPTLDRGVLAQLRARASEALEARLAVMPVPADVLVEHRAAQPSGDGPPVGLRVLRPAVRVDAPVGCVYSIHSGGMVMGRVDQDDIELANLVSELGCVAVSVDYRLAPEHPYPAGVEDCYAGLVWVHEHAAQLSIEPDRIALFGSSGGGGLAAATALLARDRGGPAACFQVLQAPMLDDRDTASSVEFSGILSWSREHNQGAWRMVLGDSAGGLGVSAYAAPARAEDLAGVPPALVQVGELEAFRDEDIDYAARLLRAGVAVELHVYPGAYHGFEGFVPAASRSARSRRDRVEALRRALGG